MDADFEAYIKFLQANNFAWWWYCFTLIERNFEPHFFASKVIEPIRSILTPEGERHYQKEAIKFYHHLKSRMRS